ncbi:MAG: tetratricopeptide repeat protein, partial [Planctomycetes bacterium]|nr:tetratricopeptide repeat protein [Planctomycetota bacterium]
MNLVREKIEQAEASPDSARAHRSLALAYSANEAWESASRSFQNALSLDPGDFEARYEMALSLSKQGASEASLEALLEVNREHPDYLPARQMLGVEYLKRDRLEEAKQHFQFIEDQGLKKIYGVLGLGEVALAEGSAEQAKEYFLQARKRDSSNLYLA